jgi:ADP-ribose pyrophosphatase YjhB (NUDIX family)
MTQPPRHSVSVAAAVINNDGQVLVIRRRDQGTWQLPGGILELGETIDAGVRREVHEETGVAIEPERLTGVYKNMNLGVVALVFRARPLDGVPQPTNEATTAEWWTTDQVHNNMTQAFAIRILDALRPNHTPAIRSHDGTHLLNG